MAVYVGDHDQAFEGKDTHQPALASATCARRPDISKESRCANEVSLPRPRWQG
jgi:hypothetical protein